MNESEYLSERPQSVPEGLQDLFYRARQNGCSDLHITAHRPPTFRRMGQLETGPFENSQEESEIDILSMLAKPRQERLLHGQDLDFALMDDEGYRYRVHVYHQQGELAAAIRLLPKEIPSLASLSLPPVLADLARLTQGLVLVTGPTGSGKTTTLAAIIDAINREKKVHILTIEDPIEYIHISRHSLVHQRESGRDVSGFARALRSAMREDPDVILVGEMRDFETISAAMTAAETGHLVLSTLHTTGAVRTIDRIVDAYPSVDQGLIRAQLSGVLKGIVTQMLVPSVSGTERVAATEILIATDAVRSLIREGRIHQLPSIMQSGSCLGMHTLASCLATLVQQGRITREAAEIAADDRTALSQYLSL